MYYKRANRLEYLSAYISSFLLKQIQNPTSAFVGTIKEIVYNTMTNVFNLKVPLDVDIELGNNWYEAK